MKAINILWVVDFDEDLETLPKEVDIPEGISDYDEIADYLSDTIGYCHEGYILVDDNLMEDLLMEQQEQM